jgi:hypothetical protein
LFANGYLTVTETFLFSALNDQAGYVYIFAGEELEIIGERDGLWRFE